MCTNALLLAGLLPHNIFMTQDAWEEVLNQMSIAIEKQTTIIDNNVAAIDQQRQKLQSQQSHIDRLKSTVQSLSETVSELRREKESERSEFDKQLREFGRQLESAQEQLQDFLKQQERRKFEEIEEHAQRKPYTRTASTVRDDPDSTGSYRNRSVGPINVQNDSTSLQKFLESEKAKYEWGFAAGQQRRRTSAGRNQLNALERHVNPRPSRWRAYRHR